MEFSIEMRARSGKLKELCQTLQAILPFIRREKGCRNCRVYRDEEDKEVFFLTLMWDSPEDVEDYLLCSTGNPLLGAVDLLSENVKIKFREDVPWEGIDILKEIKRYNSSLHKMHPIIETKI